MNYDKPSSLNLGARGSFKSEEKETIDEPVEQQNDSRIQPLSVLVDTEMYTKEMAWCTKSILDMFNHLCGGKPDLGDRTSKAFNWSKACGQLDYAIEYFQQDPQPGCSVHDRYGWYLGCERRDSILQIAHRICDSFSLEPVEYYNITIMLMYSAAIRSVCGLTIIPSLDESPIQSHFRLTEELVELKDSYKRHHLTNLNTLAELADVSYFLLGLNDQLDLNRLDSHLVRSWIVTLTRLVADVDLFKNYARVAALKWRLAAGLM